MRCHVALHEASDTDRMHSRKGKFVVEMRENGRKLSCLPSMMLMDAFAQFASLAVSGNVPFQWGDK